MEIKRGFTLIELMVVMAVIAVLATMVLFGLGKAQAAARDAARQQMMTGIQGALERYYGDYQMYPGATSWIYIFGNGNIINSSYTGGLCGYPLVSQQQGGGPCQNGYVSSLPKDPGGANCNASLSTQNNGGWTPCPSDLTKPIYKYENPDGVHCTGSLPNAYELELVKESGGTSYFCSPQ